MHLCYCTRLSVCQRVRAYEYVVQVATKNYHSFFSLRSEKGKRGENALISMHGKKARASEKRNVSFFLSLSICVYLPECIAQNNRGKEKPNLKYDIGAKCDSGKYYLSARKSIY